MGNPVPPRTHVDEARDALTAVAAAERELATLRTQLERVLVQNGSEPGVACEARRSGRIAAAETARAASYASELARLLVEP